MLYNAMITGYVQQGMGEEALILRSELEQEGIIQPDSLTFLRLLQACASVGEVALPQGEELHADIDEQGLQQDIYIGGSLVHMYAKCGCLDAAREVFDMLPSKNLVTWTAMVAGYVQEGRGVEALSVYQSMQQEGFTSPDSIFFVCLLRACATSAALLPGKQLHAHILRQGLQGDVFVGIGLVHMYSKCGSMSDSRRVFESLPQRTTSLWNALIAGYAKQGDSEAVFEMFARMSIEGMNPDATTFLQAITVCSHVGLVDRGLEYFESMTMDGITPNIEHYTCLMDLLGRAGYLDKVLEMAKNVHLSPIPAVWVTLLSACRKWNNVDIGRRAFDFAANLDEGDSAFYLLMSNLYAGVGKWLEAKEIQTRRVESQAWKQPGQSWWTDEGGMVHKFAVGNETPHENEGRYERLQSLMVTMKEHGSVV